ncbi:MAG: GDCCVxC domain-containing (seleno)protein [Steroidobacteraceae bacterium]
MPDPSPHAVTACQLACPACGYVSAESMPTDACVWFHQCAGCGTLLHPKAGDCCVFCSYGSVVCPPRQAEQTCCSGPDG